MIHGMLSWFLTGDPVSVAESKNLFIHVYYAPLETTNFIGFSKYLSLSADMGGNVEKSANKILR